MSSAKVLKNFAIKVAKNGDIGLCRLAMLGAAALRKMDKYNEYRQIFVLQIADANDVIRSHLMKAQDAALNDDNYKAAAKSLNKTQKELQRIEKCLDKWEKYNNLYQSAKKDYDEIKDDPDIPEKLATVIGF